MFYRTSVILLIALFILMVGGTIALAAQSDTFTPYSAIQGASPTSEMAPIFQTATAIFSDGVAPTANPGRSGVNATATAEAEQPDATATPKPSPTPDASAIELVSYAEPYAVAIEELQEIELIPLGGSLVYQTGYAFFDGRGRFYTPLAEFRPHTDYVIAAELEFTTSNTEELESCGLMSRIQTEGQFATAFTFAGFDSDGNPFFADQASQFAQATFDLSFDTYDLDERHHFLIIVRDDQLWMFINGELVLTSAELEPREGSYGLAMNATGFGGRCEARGLWIYELDLVWDSKDGYCGITVNSNVNLREGPGVNFELAGQIEASDVMDVEGQVLAPDGYVWWLLTSGEWVRSDFVRELGDCETLAPEVDLPDAE